ncbi:hypothetical protein IIE18_12220 [Pseudomonas sp. V1]|uniref:hypothetical protein n=1 Tax=Pseudomonas arcuscaelestis TaxID=2710591 RepID=UPI00193F272A|nr:hypothetical protein [Pseudomonas arcuscaelestis]MBM3105903.1 hypothetical protein [Pseudomonas arcuscaelestis]
MIHIRPEDLPLVFPEESYAIAWSETLHNFLPGLSKHRCREAFLRLSGWDSWDSMVQACDINEHCVQDELPDLVGAVANIRPHREILIREFGVKPAFANHFLLANPLGAFNLLCLDPTGDHALYAEGEEPSDRLDQILEGLDWDNAALVPGTEENMLQAFSFTDPIVYEALFDHLGWDLDRSNPMLCLDQGPPLMHLGHLRDPELGAVPVFLTGMSPTPTLMNDPTCSSIYYWITSPSGAGQRTALVMFREPQVRQYENLCASLFGVYLEGEHAWLFFLGNEPRTLASVVVENISSSELPVRTLPDEGFELAMRFARVKERAGDVEDLHLDGIEGPAVLAGGSGWGSMKLPQPR